jgi:folate-binding protein YgfZ
MAYKTLEDIHRPLGAAWMTINGSEVVSHYGNPDAEYRVARTAAGVVDLGQRGRLRVTGKDATRFLNGMLTRAVPGLAEGAGVHAALTSAQGETLADLRVYRTPDAHTIETEPGLQGKVRESLDRFLIADDVTIEDVSADTTTIGVLGPGAQAVLSRVVTSVPEAGCGYRVAAGLAGGRAVAVVATARGGWVRYEMLCPPDAAPAVWQATVAAGAEPVGRLATEAIRVETGLPAYGRDVDERSMPLEAGLADAVDFDKGCFVGQEALAKMHNLGKPRRLLVGLLLEADQPPAPGSTVSADGKAVGWIGSAVRSPGLGRTVALASVRRGCHEAGCRLALEDGSGAEVARLPLVDPACAAASR